ncbi:FAD dependent oxidoreductase family protein [Sphingomonas sp. S17]|nr:MULTISPECIES: NAD(P)/FAD-dependent oxidoreductase [Sphingomonas]EGI55527.1 FAD dependent oxidoreductase family protein [Sphingomonas sp. S17]MBQ1480709.1 NAD(P)/FAD-dependent oxidoreductase [Sphingomonas sp.]MCM3680343.1 NAD(P)/FAD-dependent oxidoreductase [Sphingomonas paucimobilis]NNG57214.1 NAD(P)/FAD-dependent oxidoreductase [Sphingomonas paucimobilis]QBE93261.1 NAD(P)/FAD-dependent oxidoreductase [Sphingomonas paucimobilis]
MIRLSELKLPLHHADEALPAAICRRLRVTPRDMIRFSVARRGHDARDKGNIQLVYSVDVTLKNEAAVLERFRRDRDVQRTPDTRYHMPSTPPAGAKRPVVIGAGPCGLFAALILAQAGYRPIILERGKVVRERTQDTWGLWRRSVLNPESNVQYGEGGAGTFSDGKLYSRIKDPRHLNRKVLTEFVKAGAPPEILTEAHPHIGTFRLVTMVESMRATIEELGGEYRFSTRVDGIDVETDGSGERRVRGLHLNGGGYLEADHVVLAIGHSARDSFAMLQAAGVYVEAKPFSIGVRIEHPQSWIDRARFGHQAGHPILGAAEYHISHHCSNGRTVYSFCMCPGGTVVAATSEEGRVATNGMSQYSRNERNANSGFVVAIDPERDYPGDPLAGIKLQRALEEQAFVAGGSNYKAPAQRVGDFLAGRPSTSLGSVTPSYRPGVTPTDLSQCLPDFVIAAMREAIPAFGRQIEGYDHPDVVMTGVETRTSSPVRFTRGEDGHSLNTRGLFPAGEGAGYAGGILSAAVDGIKTAEAVARSIGAA